MKTSRFEKGEAEGFSAAIEEMGVAMTGPALGVGGRSRDVDARG